MDTLCPNPLLPSSPEASGSAVAPDSQPVPSLHPPNPPLPHFRSRCRRGTIAHLPKTLRDQINEMLDDGVPYTAIRQHLGEHGNDLTKDSIGRWKRGSGYREHLRDLRLLEQSRSRYELTLDLARQEQGIDVFQAAHKIAAGLICDAVADIGADSLREAVKANPLNFLRMLHSLSRLTNGGLKCERHLADQPAPNPQSQNQPPPGSKKGFSSGSLKQMQDALELM